MRAHALGAPAALLDRYAVRLDVIAESASVRVDPATGTPHPLTLYPASAPALTLVGLGVRTVSFLKVKVYSAAFYVDDGALRRSAFGQGGDVGEVVSRILETPSGAAIRIVPVRNTDFAHLRDGLTRSLLARQKEDRKAGKLSDEQDEQVSAAIQQFKNNFPAGKVPRGGELLLVRSPDGRLALEYEGKVMGYTTLPWIGENLIGSYFGKHPASRALADDVAQGLEGPGMVRIVVQEHDKMKALSETKAKA